MKTLGSHPGAILFRLSVMIALVGIILVVFFSRLEDTEKVIETTSVLQLKRVIDSSLVVVFSSYAVNGRLDDLNALDGANPFVFLEEYGNLPPNYVGEIDFDPSSDREPGWYYLGHRRVVLYKPYFHDHDIYYSIVLNYRDLNQSGRFESLTDEFQNLQFVRIGQP